MFDQTALHVSDAAIHELDNDMAAVPDRARFSVGPGRLEARQSDALFHALIQGGGYLLSDVVMWDMDESGLVISSGAIKRLADCSISTWAIPAGSIPFHAVSLYHPKSDRFVMEPFAVTFSRHYHKDAPRIMVRPLAVQHRSGRPQK